MRATLALIRDMIKRAFGKSVSLVTTGRILTKPGMSPQRPLYRAWKQDPARVEKWKREEFPAIRARAAAEGAVILFADEASVRTDCHAGTTWAPVGCTPVVTGPAVRHAVKIVSAVGQRGECSFEVHEESMNADRFAGFPEKLLHDFRQAGLPGRRRQFRSQGEESQVRSQGEESQGVRRRNRREAGTVFPSAVFTRIEPGEWASRNVKHDKIARAVPMTRDDLKAVAVAALERLRRCPEIVRGFFGDPKLNYIHA